MDERRELENFSGDKKPHPIHEHEGSEMDLRTVFRWTAGLVITLFVSMAIARMMMSRELSEMKADPNNGTGYRQSQEPSSLKSFPSPQLEVLDEVDTKKSRLKEESILRHYGWVDRNQRMVRVPIERAMEMLLEKGLPARTNVEDSDLE